MDAPFPQEVPEDGMNSPVLPQDVPEEPMETVPEVPRDLLELEVLGLETICSLKFGVKNLFFQVRAIQYPISNS